MPMYMFKAYASVVIYNNATSSNYGDILKIE